MNVIGIDPAPAKKATIHGADCAGVRMGQDAWRCNAHRLPDLVRELSVRDGDLLLCWDAPLTAGEPGQNDCYYSRPIERFFQKGDWKTPDGISVRGYAGCPHWAVSQAALGLPRVGDFGPSGNLPFQLIAHDDPPRPTPGKKRKCVVEVHPAVAIWLWCVGEKEAPGRKDSWKYKGMGKPQMRMRGRLWRTLKRRLKLKTDFSPKDDDELDAFVAHLLGTMWLEGKGVVLLGDERTGSFLVPENVELLDGFKGFCRSLPSH